MEAIFKDIFPLILKELSVYDIVNIGNTCKRIHAEVQKYREANWRLGKLVLYAYQKHVAEYIAAKPGNYRIQAPPSAGKTALGINIAMNSPRRLPLYKSIFYSAAITTSKIAKEYGNNEVYIICSMLDVNSCKEKYFSTDKFTAADIIAIYENRGEETYNWWLRQDTIVESDFMRNFLTDK